MLILCDGKKIWRKIAALQLSMSTRIVCLKTRPSSSSTASADHSVVRTLPEMKGRKPTLLRISLSTSGFEHSAQILKENGEEHLAAMNHTY